MRVDGSLALFLSMAFSCPEGRLLSHAISHVEEIKGRWRTCALKADEPLLSLPCFPLWQGASGHAINSDPREAIHVSVDAQIRHKRTPRVLERQHFPVAMPTFQASVYMTHENMTITRNNDNMPDGILSETPTQP